MADEGGFDFPKNCERVPFVEEEIVVLRQSIEISEELISDYYKVTTSEWKRYRYDIQSLRDLQEEEVTDSAFAQIRRYLRCPNERLRGSEPGDYFKICLQDHVIRRALRRDSKILLLPLTTYIVTHELIHVIRFAKFLQRFLVSPTERDSEEVRVHELTHRLLHRRKIHGLAEVLSAFRDCRNMENFLGAVA
ncbi:MAG TPA: hypothetical protein PK250_18820 [Syntrophobacter fumaroxidans]|nr:hypothetical protein [Syntrophobacter fumaroxidans]